MRSRIALAVTALALVSACADGSGGADGLVGPNPLTGNPPPPAFTGAVAGYFEPSPVEEHRAHTGISGLSLQVTQGGTNPPTTRFRFAISVVEYNADPNLSSFWLNFPRQTLPTALQGHVAPLIRGRIVYQNGQSTGIGTIIARDSKNRGWWIIDLSQFTQPYNVFLPSCPNQNWVNCLTLNAPVIATFYRIVESGDGSRQVEAYPSKPSTLYFATGF